jgi:hypothetical protein
MADSKNPPVLPEGYDPELDKANKGMAAYELENMKAQQKRDMQDQKAKDKALSLLKFGADLFKPKKEDKEPVKKAKGGSVKSASARADGCAIRGKTRA